jgi:hypothetical protein
MRAWSCLIVQCRSRSQCSAEVALSCEQEQVKVKVTFQLTVRQSVLVSSAVWGSCLKVNVLSMWEALSDERVGLLFVRVAVSSVNEFSICTIIYILLFT